MLDVSGNACSGHYSITIRHNASLSRTGTLCVFFLIMLLPLSIAVAFALLGAWPILACCGLALGALGAAFHDACGHAQDYERLTFDDTTITLERHDRHHDQRIELNSYWATMLMQPAASGESRRLALRSHGREIEFGHLLSNKERYLLGSQLCRRFSNFHSVSLDGGDYAQIS